MEQWMVALIDSDAALKVNSLLGFLCVLLFQGGAGRARPQGDRHRGAVRLYHAVYRDERAGLCVLYRTLHLFSLESVSY